jgi:hypothetical protein
MPDLDLERLVRQAYEHFNREHEPPPMWRRVEEFFDRAEALAAAELEER